MTEGIEWELVFVRNVIKSGADYLFSGHSHDKMRKLKISIDEVTQCILSGKLIEIQAGYKGEDPRVVIYNGHEKSFYVVVSVDVSKPECVIVTVVDTDFSKWEKSGDTIIRKTK